MRSLEVRGRQLIDGGIMGTDRMRAAPTLLTLLTLLLVVLAAASAAASAGGLSADPVLDVRAQIGEQPAPAPPPTTAPSEPVAEPQAVPGDVLLGALVVLVAAGLALLVRLVLRLRSVTGPRGTGEPATDAPESGAAHPEIHRLTTWAEETRTALASGGSTTDVVIRCWLDLERRCAAAGLTRAPSGTTSDFTTAAASSLGLPAEPLTTLHRLYQRARFGGTGGDSAPPPLTRTDRELAARSVEELADALGSRARRSGTNGTTP